MFETRAKLIALDPVWRRVCEEADEAIRNEPLLGGLIHSGLLHHPSLERALAYRFSLKLASGEMSEQILREIADQAFDSDSGLGAAARSDLMAVYERDPACHRFLQPILFFKGYQAVQAYRVGHWLWRAAHLRRWRAVRRGLRSGSGWFHTRRSTLRAVSPPPPVSQAPPTPSTQQLPSDPRSKRKLPGRGKFG